MPRPAASLRPMRAAVLAVAALAMAAGLPAGPFRTDDQPMDNFSMPIKPITK